VGTLIGASRVDELIAHGILAPKVRRIVAVIEAIAKQDGARKIVPLVVAANSLAHWSTALTNRAVRLELAASDPLLPTTRRGTECVAMGL
jgi:hypothetical protein